MKVIGILFTISLLMVSCGISKNESKFNSGRKIEKERWTVGLGSVATEKGTDNKNVLNNQWKELTTPEDLALSKKEEAIRKQKTKLISQYAFYPIPISPGFSTVIYEDISLFYIGKNISNYNFSRRFLMMVNSSTLLPVFEVYFDGTYYTVAFDNNNLVKAIFIRETNIYDHHQQSFITSDGVHLGMTYRDLKNIEPNIVLNEMPGWGYFGELKSGWKVAFFIGNTMTEHFPKEDDKIEAIYKD